MADALTDAIFGANAPVAYTPPSTTANAPAIDLSAILSGVTATTNQGVNQINQVIQQLTGSAGAVNAAAGQVEKYGKQGAASVQQSEEQATEAAALRGRDTVAAQKQLRGVAQAEGVNPDNLADPSSRFMQLVGIREQETATALQLSDKINKNTAINPMEDPLGWMGGIVENAALLQPQLQAHIARAQLASTEVQTTQRDLQEAQLNAVRLSHDNEEKAQIADRLSGMAKASADASSTLLNATSISGKLRDEAGQLTNVIGMQARSAADLALVAQRTPLELVQAQATMDNNARANQLHDLSSKELNEANAFAATMNSQYGTQVTGTELKSNPQMRSELQEMLTTQDIPRKLQLWKKYIRADAMPESIRNAVTFAEGVAAQTKTDIAATQMQNKAAFGQEFPVSPETMQQLFQHNLITKQRQVTDSQLLLNTLPEAQKILDASAKGRGNGMVLAATPIGATLNAVQERDKYRATFTDAATLANYGVSSLVGAGINEAAGAGGPAELVGGLKQLWAQYVASSDFREGQVPGYIKNVITTAWDPNSAQGQMLRQRVMQQAIAMSAIARAADSNARAQTGASNFLRQDLPYTVNENGRDYNLKDARQVFSLLASRLGVPDSGKFGVLGAVGGARAAGIPEFTEASKDLSGNLSGGRQVPFAGQQNTQGLEYQTDPKLKTAK